MNKQAGYEYLLTYKATTIIYDLTVQFCRRWVSPRSRTNDQMVQAARSGHTPVEHLLAPEVYGLASQGRVYGAGNIAEGYKQKSLKGYIKLLGVTRGSQEELLKDYEDYARQNGIAVWPKEKARAMRDIRAIWGKIRKDHPYRPNHPYPLPHDKETAINLLLTLINQTNYLLDKQIDSLEKKFIEEGGYSENLFKRRLKRRREE